MDGQRIEFTPDFCAHLALLGIRGVAPGVRLVDPATAFEPPVELGFADVWKGTTRIGAFSYACPRGTLHGASVGRYCSIAEGVQVGMTRHPADWLTTSPIGYVADAFGFESFLAEERPGWRRALPLADYDLRPATTIGHDVWIGADAWIKDGVTIGDGAVIGAHAVVTRDVEPYAVVAGNPARLIRYRFTEDVVERLRRIAWWRCSLLDLPGLEVGDPAAAIDALEAAIGEGRVAAYAPEPIGIADEFARFQVVREVMDRRAA